MTAIIGLQAREILDSRGRPTVEAEVTLADGTRACASVPSGASKGRHEALERRDEDSRYNGLGVRKVIATIHEEIADLVCGLEAEEQQKLDDLLCEKDGTPNKGNLGANATLPVSLAVARAASVSLGLPLYRYLGGTGARLLPVPMMNLLNGGAHASNPLDVQEFMALPLGFGSFAESLRAGCEIYRALGELLSEASESTAVGDEGGFAPNLKDTKAALAILEKAIEKAGYRPGEEVALALDCAASEFYRKDSYHIEGKTLSGQEWGAQLAELCGQFPIVSLEDPFAEDDWDSWVSLTKKLGESVQIVGDDLFVTNIERLLKGSELGAGNAILLKPNQIGTLSETIACAQEAKDLGFSFVVSHRSGETEDAFLADLSVALHGGQIKTGAPTRGERTAKYNQLLRIEEQLARQARYPRKRGL